KTARGRDIYRLYLVSAERFSLTVEGLRTENPHARAPEYSGACGLDRSLHVAAIRDPGPARRAGAPRLPHQKRLRGPHRSRLVAQLRPDLPDAEGAPAPRVGRRPL